jgi:hypothetical protein
MHDGRPRTPDDSGNEQENAGPTLVLTRRRIE